MRKTLLAAGVALAVLCGGAGAASAADVGLVITAGNGHHNHWRHHHYRHTGYHTGYYYGHHRRHHYWHARWRHHHRHHH